MPRKSQSRLRLDQFLCFSVYAANLAFTKVYKPLLETLGLTYPQYLALVVLWERDERTVGEIGTRLGLDTNTLTPLLKRLEAAGLVARARSREDERQVLVRLTAKGRALESEAEEVPGCVGAACGLPMQELDELRVRLDRLTVALERNAAPPPSAAKVTARRR